MGTQEIRDELKRKYCEVFSAWEAPPPALLHYTDPNGVEGIIRSQEIWCTDIRCVDDPAEGDHGMGVIRDVVRRSSVPKTFINAVERVGDLFGLKRLRTLYTFSLVSSDAQKPRMWTEYGHNGTGGALAFDYARLLADSDEGKKYAVFPILYDLHAQVEAVEEIVRHAIQFERGLRLPPPDAEAFWLEEVAFSLLNCGLRFKSQSWQWQQESRLAIWGREDALPLSPGEKPHLALPFDRHALVRVIRGPRAGTGLAVTRIHELLRCAGFAEGTPIVEADN